MAGQQQYYEEPADQEYYGQEEMAGGSTGEDLTALASVPWVAIALAVHVILLVICWFIIPKAAEPVHVEVIQAQQEQIAEPPPPEQPPEEEVEFPKDEPVQEDPTEDEKIVEEATDEVNEDPSDKPNNDLAENPNDDPSDNESPHPNRDSTSSAVGLGGGVGGGGGRGGKGGFAYRRARGGGGRPHEDRTRAALEWLKDHQNREGYWSATTFNDDSTRAGATKTYNVEFVDPGQAGGDKGWEATCDIGLTGMSLLAFVGAGYDHKEGDYRATCRQAILYLRKVQDNDGCFGAKEDDHFVYNHSICAMAMAEAYGLSGDQVLKPIADKAVDFILKAQNPGLGWRYGVQPGINDSSVSGWMVLALKSCKMAGLEFDYTKCYADAAEWYNMVTVDVGGYPKCGYDSPGSNNARLRSAQEYEHNPSMDSIYVMSMLFMGKADLNDKNIKTLSRVCIEKDFLPQWDQYKIDYYYWYYASLALYQVGGSVWKTWEKAMSSTLLDNQRGYTELDKKNNHVSKEALDEHGSWDAVDAWGSAGGRVYSTAINCLTLEVYYRYLRLEGDGH
ncbi:MAG: terpene cyclase/mutase family protein [Planctomycetes bacterium]|nr:terpene cyclase/mutase family protein [Planctomycetota bacterium]MCA8935850.1 terpene cyclase/mutase family protein [Planctomycetota bacterium]